MMKYRLVYFYSLLVIPLMMPGLSLAENGDHAGAGSPGGAGRAVAAPSIYQAKLASLIGACMAGRPGAASAASLIGNLAGANALGGLAATAATGVGAAIFQSRCESCHQGGRNDARFNPISRVSEALSGTGIISMPPPPAAPLSPEQQAAVVKYIQTGS